MSSVDWRVALATVLTAIAWADAAAAGERETPQEFVLRCLGHIQRGEISAVIPLFAPESLPEISWEQLEGGIQILGLSDQINSQLIAVQSGDSADGVPVHTIIYHLRGPDRALLAIGQVRNTDSGQKLIGLRFNSAPMELSDLFPFVISGISYVHYYMMIGLLLVPALMVYATVQCLRRESRIGWAWIPLIMVGVGRATAVWVPGPADERLFSFVPMAITVFGVEIQRAASFEPWQVTVSAPLGAIIYLWWSDHRSRTRVDSQQRASRAPDTLSV
jgi:hypothetical protein